MIRRLSFGVSDAKRCLYIPERCQKPKYAPIGPCIDTACDLIDIVTRPWGTWEELVLNYKCTVRILCCNPGQRLSDQRHWSRDELFAILDPETVVELDGEVLKPIPGDYVFIPCGVWHRLICAGSNPVRVLEVAFGEYDQTNDIERRHDIYGRPLKGKNIGAV